MANRNNRQPMGNRRMDFGRIDRSKGYGRPMPVSPWQAGGPGAPLGNILPLATNSEATLALANNLINNLLQSRQNVVPSLLDMPIRRDFGGDMNRGFDRGYNRMGNQSNFRRPIGNYVRPADRPNYRKPFRPNDGPKNKPNQSQKKDAAESKAKPVKVESTESEAKESQVKEEPKEDGVKVEVKVESKEEAAGDAGSEAAPAAAAPAAAEGEKKEGPKTAYDAVNPALLHCHICNKMMWDGRSFENHLNGRAHYIMMQKTSEGYALTADTMRQELKIREMKHYRKLGQGGPRNFFCAMCDTYAADGSAHRTTVGHRKLKKYLHPACTFCHREMATRIELDEHRLSAEHLLNVQGRRKEFTVKPKPEVMMISTLSTEEAYVRYDRDNGSGGRRQHRGAAKPEPKKTDAEGAAGEAKGEGAAEGAAEGAGDGDTEMAEPEVALLDVKEGDDLSAVTKEMIPAYKPERGVGRSFLTDFTCVHCKLCRKLLDSQETAEVHLRTWRHHLLYVKHLQRGNKPEEDAAQTATGGGNARTAAVADGGKRSAGTDSSDDGNWKRRKTTNNEMDDDAADEDEENADGGDGDGQDADEEMQEGEDPDGDEQEKWEQDLQTLMKGVSEELDTAIEGADAAKNDKSAAAEKSVAAPEPEPEEAAEEAPPPPQTPSRGRGGRGGRGRGRGARGRRS